MDYQRQIGEYLLIEPCVTATWLANTLQVSVTKAAALLAEFKQGHKDIHATYLINGRDAQHNFIFSIAVEDEMEKIKKSLSSVSSTQIYSLQRVDTESIKTQIVETYMSLATSLLADGPSAPTSDTFVGNSLGQIVMKGLDVRPVGERILSTQNKHWTKSVHVPSSSMAAVATAKAAASASSSVSAAPVVSHIKNTDQVKAFFNKQSSATPAPAVKAEPKAETKNFFKTTSNTSQTSSQPASQESDTPLEVLKPKADKVKSPAKKKVTKDDEDEEFDDGTGPTVGKKRSSPSPKKNVPAASLLEESEEEEGGIEEVKAKKAKTAKTNVNVRGALDDFMEEAAIESFKKEQENPTQKKTKRVLVEKMFSDEKGYLVTEMIWEEVTDDEKPNLTDIKPQKAKASESTTLAKTTSAESKTASTAGKGKKDAPAKSSAPQKNMMSFFTKK